MMKSFKTYLTITALVFSASVLADRSRDGGRNAQNKKVHSQHVQKQKNHNSRVNKQYQRTHNSRQEVVNQKRRNNHSNYGQRDNNRRNNHYSQNSGGFNGDYRDNRRFDNSNRRNNNHAYNNNYGYNSNRHGNYNGYNSYNRGHISHNYYKPKKHYKKWKKRMKHYRRDLRNQYRHFYNYNVYTNDLYRYRPLRGLGHYFDRQGFGYGHWHEGSWCASYHDDRFYRDYYAHYRYDGGWRHGDGDFGIWFSF